MNARVLLPLCLAVAGFAPPTSISAAGASAPAAPPSEKAPATRSAPFVRTARTGHVSNYDEKKVGPYVLPDPLVLANGERVPDSATWMTRRRNEILEPYNKEIYGRVPANAPRAHAEVITARERVAQGTAERTHVVLHFGDGADAPRADVTLDVPTRTQAPVPALLQMVFVRGLPDADGGSQPRPSGGRSNGPSETGPVAEILQRGYAYATYRYTDVQPDDGSTHEHGVEAQAYAPGQTRPAPDEWGAITAWAWSASRVLDYLATNDAIDPRRVALIGHSRLGKTALWAGAQDSRFVLVFASCSGEMGASLARRDFGETVDDMAEIFPWWFAGNFQKYAGHWNDLPVDAHLLIALNAPRPVFVTGGTDDQWADPRGEFQALVAAGPVYRLLGKKDLGVTELPAPDHPVITGSLGWLYHTGPHAILPGDWAAFLDFADRHLK